MLMRLVVVFCMIALQVVCKAQSYEQLVERGLAAVEHDSLPQAEELFKQALRLAPQDYRNSLVLTNLGKVEEMMYWRDTKNTKLADAALDAYTLALNMVPESVPMLMARGKFLLALGQLGKAQMDLTNVLDIDPSHTEARNYRAYIYSQQRLYDQAREDYNRVLKVDAANENALLGLAILDQQEGHIKEAVERMTGLVEAHPQNAEYHSVRASMYAETNAPELAILDLDHAVALDSSNTNYLLSRAYLHLHQGNKRLARTDFEAAIALGIPRSSLRKELKRCK